MPLFATYINYKERLSKSLSVVFGHLCVKIYLGILVAINSAIWVAVYYISTKVTEDLVVLHYNVDFGVDLVGEVGNMYMIPTLGFIVLAVNFFLVFLFVGQKDLRVLAHFLLGGATAVNFFLLVSLAPIYLINFT